MASKVSIKEELSQIKKVNLGATVRVGLETPFALQANRGNLRGSARPSPIRVNQIKNQ